MKLKSFWPAYIYLTIIITLIYFLSGNSNQHFSDNNVDWSNPKSWIEAEDLHYKPAFKENRNPSSNPTYTLNGECHDFPKVDVDTAPGFCLGQIDNGDGLLKPRFAIELKNKNILLTDMGSWDPMKGRIFLYVKKENQYERKMLFNSSSFPANDPRAIILDRPHQLLIGPDNLVYVGTSTAIVRFNPEAQDPLKSIEVVIKGIPGLGLHNLKTMTFNNKKQLFVNVGSATNVCQKFGIFGSRMKSCPEVDNLIDGQGQIRVYQLLDNGKFDPNFKIFAKGLRNSMGLIYDSRHDKILQAENGRDEISKNNSALSDSDYPHDEFNIIEANNHYGWPYCYDDNKNNPEWKNINCQNYKAPYLLLPAHSAPLTMMIHSGNGLSAWYQNRMIMALHGYAPNGHRIVSFLRDENGMPTGVPLSLVYNWKTNEGKPGSPVSVFEMQDGSILMVEDNNKKLLILSYDDSLGDGKPVREIDNPNVDNESDANEDIYKHQLEEALRDPNVSAFAKFQNQVIDQKCVLCHGGVASPGIQFKKYDYIGNSKKIIELNKVDEIIGRISGNPNYPQMPPSGFNSSAEQKAAVDLLLKWKQEIKK